MKTKVNGETTKKDEADLTKPDDTNAPQSKDSSEIKEANPASQPDANSKQEKAQIIDKSSSNSAPSDEKPSNMASKSNIGTDETITVA